MKQGVSDVTENLILAIRSRSVHCLREVKREIEITVLPEVQTRVAYHDIRNSSRGEATRGRSEDA